jgi:predicted Zn-dependent protease with MMP-like domain
MITVPDELFQELVARAVRAIPERFARHLDNVAFMVADQPTAEQLEAGGVLHGEADDDAGFVDEGTLLGLYEGIPLPERDTGYSGVLPDVITIFKQPHEVMAADETALARDVHQTVWHEVAHYFGLDHGQIAELER